LRRVNRKLISSFRTVQGPLYGLQDHSGFGDTSL
jgi:hypothetical protein